MAQNVPAAALIATLFLSACASNPARYPELTQDDVLKEAQNERKSERPSLPVNRDESVKQLALNADIYREYARELRIRYYDGSDVSNLGGLVGAAAGLAKKTGLAGLGLLLNVGGDLHGQRYSLKTQASNLDKAATSMECIRDLVRPFDELTVRELEAVNTHMVNVRNRLASKQGEIDPANTNAADIKKLIEQQVAAEQAVRDARQAQRLQAERPEKPAALARASAEEQNRLDATHSINVKVYEQRLLELDPDVRHLVVNFTPDALADIERKRAMEELEKKLAVCSA